MNGIEKITARIAADADQEIAQLKAQAQQEADAILADSAAQAQRLSEEIIARGRKAADERLDLHKIAAKAAERGHMHGHRLGRKAFILHQCHHEPSDFESVE